MSYIGNEPVISATRTITEVVASGGQTIFYPNGGYTVGYLDVAVNGSLLQATDFVATNGTSVTLNVACASGDDVRLIAWGTFTSSSSYTQAQIDSKIGASQFGFKNRIINGAMNIAQRGTSVAVANNFVGYGGPDRFVAGNYNSGGAFTQSQASLTIDGTTKNSVRATVTSPTTNTGSGTNRYEGILQIIEGFNTFDLVGSKVAVSFIFNTNVSGTYSVALVNGALNRSYVSTFSAVANTPTRVSIVTDVVPSVGMSNTNGFGMLLYIGAVNSATYQTSTLNAWQSAFVFTGSGHTNWTLTNGNFIEVSELQLEKGSTATSFDYRPYGTELALCQRYYYKTTPGAGISFQGAGVSFVTNGVRFVIPCVVPMRTSPSALEQSGTASDYGVLNNSAWTTCSAVPALATASSAAIAITFIVAGGLTAGGGAVARAETNNGYLGWSAEL